MPKDCLDPRELEMLEKISGQIDEYGWSVVAVGASDERAPFAYTVGLTEQGSPEILLTGPLDPRIVQGILNDIAENFRDQLVVGNFIVGALGNGFELRVDDCDVYDAEMFVAVKLFGDAVRAVQVVWPDAGGHFPGEPAGWSLDDNVQPLYPAHGS